jgi:hypothetical protein
MPHRRDLKEKVLAVGLVSSFVAVAAIGLTVVMDNGRSVFGEWGTRPERLFLLLLAAGICLLHIFVRLAIQRSCERTGRAAQQILRSLEAEADAQRVPIGFELASQVRVAIDRITFAIKQMEQFASYTDQMREAGLQLLDAMQKLESADRSFLNRLRAPTGLQGSHTPAKDVNGQAGKSERLGNL